MSARTIEHAAKVSRRRSLLAREVELAVASIVLWRHKIETQDANGRGEQTAGHRSNQSTGICQSRQTIDRSAQACVHIALTVHEYDLFVVLDGRP